MDLAEKISSGLKNFFQKNKNEKIKIILILGFLGIFLILISEIPYSRESGSEIEKESVFYETDEKESDLEQKIEKAISKIKGAGKTIITITLDSSEEYYYAKNASEDNDGNNKAKEYEYVIIEGDKREEPLIIKKSEAKIRGVLIVCEGGKNPLVCEKITEAVCALLDIPSNKVSVAEMA